MRKAIMLLFVMLCAFLFLCVAYIRVAVFDSGPLEETINVVVEKGDGVKRVAWKLYKNKVISSPEYFEILTKVYKTENKLKAGEYQFKPHISMYEVMQQIVAGKVYLRRLTLPEGLTSKQMLDIIDSNQDLMGEISLSPKEGYMLPETYTFSYGDTKDDIIKRSLASMDKFLQENWDKKANELPIKNYHELLTLASIVEKETGLPQERGLVASVFINRLHKGMMLQTDPTVIYAITKGQKDLDRALRRKDLQLDDPYNTYTHYGLPPTPICSPSKAAILSVLQPEQTDYLYFVATGNGGHNFAKALKEHNKNVAEYLRVLKNK